MDGTRLSEFQKSLLDTINACGRTLLDTMNQVLDFSKIVSLEKSWRQIRRSRDNRREVDNLKGVDSMAALLDSYVCEDIALLAEEVVEGVCLGHAYGRSTSSGSTPSTALSPPTTSPVSTSGKDGVTRPEVEVIVDIEEGNWVYRTQPGALRRIIMNIFGNSMKYTERGRVSLRLESVQADEAQSSRKESEQLVLLTVSDTGKGISEDFLRARLYTPFAQEDTLAVGTGLGLAIVRSIVKSLEGHISIKSHAGEGTVVKVSLPLTRPSPEEAAPVESRSHQQMSAQDMHELRHIYAEKTVAILGFDPKASNNSELSRVMARYITDWFGLKLESWPPLGPVDVLLAQDYDLTEEVKAQSSAQCFLRSSALIVLCSNAVEHDTHRRAWSSLAASIDFLRRPCGPHKLARSILRCVKQLSASPVQHVSMHPPLDRTRSEKPPVGAGDLGGSSPAGNDPGKQPLEQQHNQPDTTGGPPESVQVSAQESAHAPDETCQLEDSVDGCSAPPPEVEETIAPEPSPEQRDSTMSRPINVLVVDDNQINLRLLLTYLKRRNIGVLDSAENGKMAVEALEKRPEGYDIIFMGKSHSPRGKKKNGRVHY